VGDLAAVAERLRLVRSARRKFLRMWAIDQALVEPLLDKVAADVTGDADHDTDVSSNHPLIHDPDPGADRG
jgi:hypothetical protein